MIVGRAVDVMVASSAVKRPAKHIATIIAQNRKSILSAGAVDLVGKARSDGVLPDATSSTGGELILVLIFVESL